MSSERFWVLQGSKPGDNAQALRLAEATGIPFSTRKIVLKPGFEQSKPRVTASLHHVDLAASDPIASPWPEVVLSIGRRMAMAALWIKAQSPATRLVQIGPPKRQSEVFDLIIVPLHYRVADAPNICRIGLPLLGVEPERVIREGRKFAPLLANLPKPLTVFLAGGSTGSHSLDPATASDLLQSILALQRRDGGSVYITTSRRTPKDSAEALAKDLPKDAFLHRWAPDDSDNPYLGLLAHGDRFVVTGDSISMLIEVARLGKPLAIASLRPANRTVANTLAKLKLPRGIVWRVARIAGELIERTPLGSGAGTRDFNLLHKLMYEKCWAVPFGEPFVTPLHPPPDDAAIAANRLRALFAERES